ncbi:MAG TPA: ATP-binding cassette domain-containing protein [Candidatus Bathyarchaeota archaeon]|nr:ATP-binding cassette domain-containing protein [Candidatus Bathyarchaeota archaeon]
MRGLNRINTIEVKALTKIFDKDVKAVDGISFNVKEGEILGFLGPNGAGKTTTLNMLSTLLRPTSGTATINGHDILTEPDAVRRSIGYVFQDTTLDIDLTGNENLDFHGRLYGLDRNARQQRIKELLELVQLSDRADDLVKTYSGGMKRRLEIARGLLHHPKVLFLDEPTLGLDPQTRRSIWEHIQRLNQEKNVTIILTTHYTEEADYLCTRILIIDFGRIVALDTPDNLKARLKGDVVTLLFKNPAAIEKFRPLLENKNWVHRINVVTSDNNYAAMSRMMQNMPTMTGNMDIGGTMPEMNSRTIGVQKKLRKLSQQKSERSAADKDVQIGGETCAKCLNLLVDSGGHRIPEIVKLADEAGVVLESVELRKPTLDDVFLSVTGRNIREEKGSIVDMVRRHRIMQQARGRQIRD